MTEAIRRAHARYETEYVDVEAGRPANVDANGDSIRGKVKGRFFPGDNALLSVGNVRVTAPLGIRTSKLPKPADPEQPPAGYIMISGTVATSLPLANRWLIDYHPFGADDGAPLPFFLPEVLGPKLWQQVQGCRLYRSRLPDKLAKAVRAADAKIAGEFDHLSFCDGQMWAHRADGASPKERKDATSSKREDRSEAAKVSKKAQKDSKRKKRKKKDKPAPERDGPGSELTSARTPSRHHGSRQWRRIGSGLAAVGSMTAGLLLVRAGWLLFREIDFLDGRMTQAVWGIPGRVEGTPGLVDTATTVLLLAATVAVLSIAAAFLGSWKIPEERRSPGRERTEPAIGTLWILVGLLGAVPIYGLTGDPWWTVVLALAVSVSFLPSLRLPRAARTAWIAGLMSLVVAGSWIFGSSGTAGAFTFWAGVGLIFTLVLLVATRGESQNGFAKDA